MEFTLVDIACKTMQHSRVWLLRVRIFNSALDKMMSLYTNNASSVEEFVKVITEEASSLLQVQRPASQHLVVRGQ